MKSVYVCGGGRRRKERVWEKWHVYLSSFWLVLEVQLSKRLGKFCSSIVWHAEGTEGSIAHYIGFSGI